MFGQVAGWRGASPSVDAGDPRNDRAVDPSLQNLLTNPSFEPDLAGWTTNVSASSSPVVFHAYAGTRVFNAGIDPEGFAQQKVDLQSAGFTALQLDSGNLTLRFGGRLRSAQDDTVDTGSIRLTFLDQFGSPVGDTRVVRGANPTDRWELVGDQLDIPAGARSVIYRYEADRNGEDDTLTLAHLDAAFLYVVEDTEAAAPDLGPEQPTESFIQPKLALRSPDLYRDWERDRPLPILWNSTGNNTDARVRIELVRSTPAGQEFVALITPNAVDNGQWTWIPFDDNGIDYDTHNLMIRISLVGQPAAADHSTEVFSVPQAGDVYYVNVAADVDLSDNQYASAPGSNRNTGKTPADPKPHPVNVLRVYELSGGEAASIDPGLYPLIDSVSFSGQTGTGGPLGRDRGFMFRGATTGTVELAPAIPGNFDQTLIFLDDADLMQLLNLTLTGGRQGIRAIHNSDQWLVQDVNIRDSHQYGVLIEGQPSDTGDVSRFTLNNVTIQDIVQLDGLRVETEFQGQVFGTLNNVDISGARYGVHFDTFFGQGGLEIDGAELANNRLAGMRVSGSLTNTWNNLIVHDNPDGVISSGNLTVTNAKVFNHSATGWAHGGIQPLSLSDSDFYENSTGLRIGMGQVLDSVFHDNTVGVEGFSARRPDLSGKHFLPQYDRSAAPLPLAVRRRLRPARDNLFYNHATAAITVDGARGLAVVNNTIYEPSADGVYLTESSADVQLRNNIIVVSGGTACPYRQ